MTTLVIIFIAVAVLILICCVAGLVWLSASVSSQRTSVDLLGGQLEAIKSSQDQAKDTINKSLQLSQVSLNDNLQSSQKILSQLDTKIGQLQSSTQHMLKMGTDLRRLQNILSSPKLRGQIGEWSLENLLSQCLPKEGYSLQHSFKDGKIADAVVKFSDYTVAIDAKFPLSGFEKITQTEDENERAKLRRQFISDCFKHIDKISESYILPAEGTLDFAIMYIPAENIYYETIVKYAGESKDLLKYALDKKVIPVSPNLLYAYLMTVAMGLHGMQIEKKAAEIRQNLGKLNADFASFISIWDVMGKHLRNASSQYDEGGKKLDRFRTGLDRIQSD